jgi:hypothetical protein
MTGDPLLLLLIGEVKGGGRKWLTIESNSKDEVAYR